jgi:hypothetical protein
MLNRKLGVIAVFVGVVAGNLFGGTFASFKVGDVLIGFRKVPNGSTGDGGGTNLVVDAGPVSYFTNLAPNTKVIITNFTGGQLSQVGTNNVGWSVFSYFDSSVVSPAFTNTLFITSPRSDINTQTSPQNNNTISGNGVVINQLYSIVAGAQDNYNTPFSPLNTSSAVLESDSYNYGPGYDVSYYVGVGPNLDFNGTFGYNFENYTPANFVTAGNPVRSDFYEMIPRVKTSSPKTYAQFLGYFEFETNGVLAYVAYPAASVTAPVIQSFKRTGTTNTITFSTGSSGTYTLRATNSVGLATARTNWPAIIATNGIGGNVTLTQVTTSSNFFYLITAQ